VVLPDGEWGLRVPASWPRLARSPDFYRPRTGVHRAVTAPVVMLSAMADFLVVVGIVVFVAAMLGLIWGLERI
jgi:hypothetical protein